jgi:hypothetical protein
MELTNSAMSFNELSLKWPVWDQSCYQGDGFP